jgi:pantoate--beta-alanine ligase
MLVLRALDEIKHACRTAAESGRLGLVPTMGALHAGHLSLVRRARAECEQVAVSIFVNPLQFGDPTDLQRYPRVLDQDAALLSKAGADIVAALQQEQMYPAGFATRVTQSSELTEALEGSVRPDHFEGVLTVVAKLFGIAGPCRAYFGRKDFQQTVVVRRMIADLDLPVELVVCDILRDQDGMALSSRNVFLSADDRQRGLSLVRALARAEQLFSAGERSGPAIEAAMQALLTDGLGRAPDYAALVDPDDMSRRDVARPGDVAVVAGRAGDVRLLDNHVLGTALTSA